MSVWRKEHGQNLVLDVTTRMDLEKWMTSYMVGPFALVTFRQEKSQFYLQLVYKPHF